MIAVIEIGSVDNAINYINDILVSGVLGGKKVSEIYLREKTLDNNAYAILAREVNKQIISNKIILSANSDKYECGRIEINNDLEQVRLIVSYRDGLAYTLQADAVHFSFNDFVNSYRLPKNKFKSVSVHSIEEALLAEKFGADRLMTGHIFATKCKDTEPRGLGYLSQIIKAVRIPVVAIGGITADNYKSVIEVGACDIAVMNSWRNR